MVAREKFYEVPDVNVHELLLDSSNPRIRHGVDQHDCIDRIVKDREAFMNLLRDIASHGLSPEHILLSPNGDGKWVVRDGNRRVTALKLLTRPSLCLPNEQLHNIIQRIVADMPAKLPETVNCLACDDEATMVDYLRRKHTGENAGIGQVRWDALLISLFNVHVGVVDQNRRAAQLILWEEDHGLSVGNAFPITTLTRALNTETLKLLGFTVENDQLVATLTDTQAYALVTRVIGDIASGRVHVKRDDEAGSIYSPEDAAAYFRKVREEVGPHEPGNAGGQGGTAGQPGSAGAAPGADAGAPGNASGGATGGATGDAAGQGSNTGGTSGGGTGSPDSGASGGANGGTSGGSGGTQAAGKGNQSGTTAKPSWDRPCLFGRRRNSTPGFAIPTSEAKLSTIVGELRQLDPNATPLAVTMLLRALIERSDIAYRAKHGLPEKGALHKNVAASADHMKTSGALTVGEHDLVMRYSRHDAGMLHIKTIQAYIHEAEFHPNGQGLNTTWDEIGCFVRACWA